jgi:hypothetical protein
MMHALTSHQRRWAVALLLVLAAALAWVLAVGTPPQGTELKLRELVLQMTWKAALLDAALALALLLTLRWWAAEDSRPAPETQVPKLSRWAILSLLGLLVLAAAVRVPRLSLSLYNDEAHNFTRLYCGSWKPQDGVPTLRPVKPFEVMWQNSAGNNSQPYSLLAASSYTLWLEATGSLRGEVCEWAVRLPALVAGLLSLWVLGLLGYRWAGLRGMVCVMLIAALHPWHVRYSTEARGYSLMLLGVSLMALGLDKALLDGRWRSWLLMSGGVFLSAWSFVGSVYYLAAFFMVLMLRQLACWRWHSLPLCQVLRPLVAGCVAVLAGAPLLLPMLPQLLKVLETFTSIHGSMGLEWWQNVGSYLLLGCPAVGAAGNPEMLSFASLWSSSLLHKLFIPVLLMELGRGLYLLWQRGGSARMLLCAAVLGVLLAWLMMSARGHYLHLWYVLYALPALLLALGLANTRGITALPAIIVLLFATWHFTSHGRQDERSAAELALGGIWPHGKAEATLATLWTNTPIYHPATIVLTQSAELEPLVQAARSTGRPLFVSMAHRGSALTTHGDAVRRLEGPEFELIRTFWGQDEDQFTAYLFKLKQ